MTHRPLGWIRHTYRSRFGIASSYRQVHQAKIKTSSRNPVLRLWCVAMAFVLRNVWGWLHAEVIAVPRRGARTMPPGSLRFARLLLWLVFEVADHYNELSYLLDTINHERPRYYPFFLLLARTGMRLGEAIGLQWGDIDWQRKMIHIQRSIRDGMLGTTKSGNTRRIDMSSQLTDVLRMWQTDCEIEAIERGVGLPEWVFTTRGGQPFHASHLRNWVWRHCLARAGFRHIKIHSLRHTYASLLIQQGESLAYIRDQLGHHSIQLTVDVYGHLVPGGNRQAVDRLDDTRSDVPTRNSYATIPNKSSK